MLQPTSKAKSAISLLENNGADNLKLRQQHEMELLSLQHEIRSKNTKIKQLQSKYDQLENNFKYILTNHKELIGRLAELEGDLKEERERSSEYQNKIQLQQIEITKLSDSEERNGKLRQEIESLKKINKNLQDTLMDTEKLKEKKQNKQYETIIEQLKQEIKQWNDKFSEQYIKYNKIVSKYKVQETQLESLMEKKEKKSVPCQTMPQPLLDAEAQTTPQQKPITYSQSVQTNIEIKEVKKEIPPVKVEWVAKTPFVREVEIETASEEIPIVRMPVQKPKKKEAPPTKPKQETKQEVPKEIREIIEAQHRKQLEAEKENDKPRSVTISQRDVPKEKKQVRVSFVQSHSENQCTVRFTNIRQNTNHFFKEWGTLPFFLSVDFFKHETQLSNMTYGVTTELAFERVFEFENNSLFLYYLANGSILVQLTIAHSIDNCEVIGQSEIKLSEFIKEGTNCLKGTTTLFGKANKTQMATLDFEITLKDPIPKIVSNFRSSDTFELFTDKFVSTPTISDHNNSRYAQYEEGDEDTSSDVRKSVSENDDQHESYLDEELLNQQLEHGDSF